MSSLCITRSISVESQDGFYSPSVDLGKDFEYLIRKCIAEKMAREQELSDAFGNDQSEPHMGSLDMPLDTEIERETNTSNTEEESNMTEKLGENHLSQHKEEKSSEMDKKLPDEFTNEENVPGRLNTAGSDTEEESNMTEKPDENHLSQHKEEKSSEMDKKLPDEFTNEENVPGRLNIAGSDTEVEMTDFNPPERPHEVHINKEDNAAEYDELFAEFEFPPLVKGKKKC